MCVQNIPFIPQLKIKLVEFSHLENSSILIIIRKKKSIIFFKILLNEPKLCCFSPDTILSE